MGEGSHCQRRVTRYTIVIVGIIDVPIVASDNSTIRLVAGVETHEPAYFPHMLESKLPFELVFDVLRSNQRWWMRRLFLAGFDINLPFFFHPFTPVPCSSLSTYTLRVLQSTNTTSNLSSHSITIQSFHNRC
jgi:hypothetical protein